MTEQRAYSPVNELVLSQGSLTGVTFEQRVAAAAAGGFTAIGLSLYEYDRLRAAGTSDEEMLCILAVYDVKVAELDGLHSFAAADNQPGVRVGSSKAQDDQTLERLLDLADLFHARHLQVLGTSNTDKLEDDAVEKFQEICDQAAQRRLEVSLEPRPNTNIASIRSAAMIVSRAQRRNAGLCITTGQHFKAKNAAADLLAIPADLISAIRLSHEVTAPGALDFTSSAIKDGRGTVEEDPELIRFLQAITQHGVSVTLSVDATPYRPNQTDPFAFCALLQDKTASIWNQAIRN